MSCWVPVQVLVVVKLVWLPCDFLRCEIASLFLILIFVLVINHVVDGHQHPERGHADDDLGGLLVYFHQLAAAWAPELVARFQLPDADQEPGLAVVTGDRHALGGDPLGVLFLLLRGEVGDVLKHGSVDPVECCLVGKELAGLAAICLGPLSVEV